MALKRESITSSSGFGVKSGRCLNRITPFSAGSKGVGNRYVASWTARGDEASFPGCQETVPDTFFL